MQQLPIDRSQHQQANKHLTSPSISKLRTLALKVENLFNILRYIEEGCTGPLDSFYYKDNPVIQKAGNITDCSHYHSGEERNSQKTYVLFINGKLKKAPAGTKAMGKKI